MPARWARLVQAISELAGVDDLQPDVDVRQDGVTVRMITFTKDYAGMTRRVDSPAEDLVDRHSRGLPFCFEQMEQPRPDVGGAIHIVVWFRTSRPRLADAAGNEADLATTTGHN